MDVPGRYFRIVRWILKVFMPLKVVQPLSDLQEQPCVILCRHRNMRGPFYSIVRWGGKDVRTWVYHPFCAQKPFYDQMYGYTLTKRLHFPDPLARFCSWFMSIVVPPLINSLGGIPVYRNDGRIRETFRLSLDQLEQGRSILIFPDIDYTSNDAVGELYDGFFMLERMYYKKTGRHLPFVPALLDTKAKSLTFGKPIVFGEGAFNAEMAKAKETLLEQWR